MLPISNVNSSSGTFGTYTSSSPVPKIKRELIITIPLSATIFESEDKQRYLTDLKLTAQTLKLIRRLSEQTLKIDKIKDILRKEIRPNRIQLEKTLLQLALERLEAHPDRKEILDLLVKKGCDVEETIAKFIKEDYIVHICSLLSILYPDEDTLVVAIKMNNLELLRFLFSKHGDHPLHPRTQKKLFVHAFIRGHTDLFKTLFARCDMTHIFKCSDVISPPCDAKETRLKVLKMFLSSNVYELNQCDLKELFFEIFDNCEESLFKFLSSKFYNSLSDHNFKEIIREAESKRVTCPRSFYLTITTFIDDDENTILSLIIKRGLSVQNFICPKNIDRLNTQLRTPLTIAVEWEQYNLIEELIRNGANPLLSSYVKGDTRAMKALRESKNLEGKSLLDIYDLNTEEGRESLSPFYTRSCLMNARVLGSMSIEIFQSLVEKKLYPHMFSYELNKEFFHRVNNKLCDFMIRPSSCSSNHYIVYDGNVEITISKEKVIKRWFENVMDKKWPSEVKQPRGDYEFKIKRSKIEDQPWQVLDEFSKLITAANRHKLSITFITDEGEPEKGFDLGGLSRQFINQLLTSLCEKGPFIKGPEGLFKPYLLLQEYNEDIRKGLAQIGQLLMLCMNVKQQDKLLLTTGSLFEETFFRFLKESSLFRISVRERDFSDPKIFDELFLEYRALNSHNKSTTAMLENIDACLYATSESCEYTLLNLYRTIEYEPEVEALNLNADIEQIKANVPVLISCFRNHVAEVHIIPHLFPLQIITEGMRDSQFRFYTSFTNLIMGSSSQRIADVIQGKLDKNFILDRLVYDDNIPTRLREWIVNWICEASEEKLKLLLFALSGSTSLGSTSRIRVVNGICISFSTCFLKFKVNKDFSSNEVFVESLERALINIKEHPDMGYS